MNGRHGGRPSRGIKHGSLVTLLAGTLSLSTLAATAHADSSKISPQLATELAAKPATQVPVVITLTDQTETDAATPAATTIRRLRATALASQGAVLADLDGPAKRFWLVNAVATKVSAAEAADLAANPEVRSIDLDFQVTVSAQAPAATAGMTGWGVDAIGAQNAWSVYGTTGRGVRIGSIDTGVDASNPQLAGAVVAWKDFINGQPTPYDDNGHGTHTIGTMAARNTGGAKIGVAPEAQVVVAKAMGANGSSSSSSLLAAAQWMTDPDGNPATADYPTVINNSWTSVDAQNEWFRPMVQTWVAMGITPVFSSGNSGGDVASPASYPEVITVGATDETGGIWSGSSRGQSTWTINGASTTIGKPDVVAPGVGVVSTVPGGFGGYTGTSMAAPHVAAAIALMKQANPAITTEQIRSILRGTAHDAGTPGVDLAAGSGLIDAQAAVGATGAPVIGQPQAAPAPAAVTTADLGQPVATATRTITAVKVARRGRTLVVTGRVSTRARVTARAVATRDGRAIARTANARTSFRIVVPAPRAGGYRVTVTAATTGGTVKRTLSIVR